MTVRDDVPNLARHDQRPPARRLARCTACRGGRCDRCIDLLRAVALRRVAPPLCGCTHR